MNSSDDYFTYSDTYGVYVRPDGAVRTRHKGVHFGNTTHNGYCEVRTKFGMRRVHRVVLDTFVGPCPEGSQVNHKNGLRTDNRLANLEYCTPQDNVRDRVLRCGARGSYYRPSGRWQAELWGAGRMRHLGMFDTEGEAHNAYVQAREKLWKE